MDGKIYEKKIDSDGVECFRVPGDRLQGLSFVATEMQFMCLARQRREREHQVVAEGCASIQYPGFRRVHKIAKSNY